jgi:hypothetical protein
LSVVFFIAISLESVISYQLSVISSLITVYWYYILGARDAPLPYKNWLINYLQVAVTFSQQELMSLIILENFLNTWQNIFK